MPQYCDSKKLEHTWFCWLLSSKVPALEKYRELGLLWTKIVGVVEDKSGVPITRNGKTFPNPLHPIRSHCLALATPLFFDSVDGVPPTDVVYYIDGEPHRQVMPSDDDLTLISDSPLHNFDQPLSQMKVVIPHLQNEGYIKEGPTKKTWHALLEDINKICGGISLRFKPRSEEEHQELTNDAVLQVINKLSTYKLVYTPGQAPVFNLLTTTIHRILYSVMNKRKHGREGLSKVLEDAEAGVLPTSNRSLRTQTGSRSRIK